MMPVYLHTSVAMAKTQMNRLWTGLAQRMVYSVHGRTVSHGHQSALRNNSEFFGGLQYFNELQRYDINYAHDCIRIIVFGLVTL